MSLSINIERSLPCQRSEWSGRWGWMGMQLPILNHPPTHTWLIGPCQWHLGSLGGFSWLGSSSYLAKGITQGHTTKLLSTAPVATKFWITSKNFWWQSTYVLCVQNSDKKNPNPNCGTSVQIIPSLNLHKNIFIVLIIIFKQ